MTFSFSAVGWAGEGVGGSPGRGLVVLNDRHLYHNNAIALILSCLIVEVKNLMQCIYLSVLIRWCIAEKKHSAAS